MKNLLFLVMSFFSVLAVGQDLNGVWNGNNKGTYYIRHIDNDVWWFGDGGSLYGHVFHGKIHGNLIFGKYVDVPTGRNRSIGSFTLEIKSSSELVIVWSDGSTANERYTRGVVNKGLSGGWKTNYGKMTLVKNGNKVTGTYNKNNGKINGTINGNILTGTWSQDNGSGELVMTFNKDFTSFTCRYTEDNKWHNDWTGTKLPGE